MSRTTDQPSTPASAFIQHFEHSVYKNFSFWKEFSVKALALYKNEQKLQQQKIKLFDAEQAGRKAEFDEHGSPMMTDGWEAHEDEALSLDFQKSQILPLLFVGAFNHFEKSLKDLVEEICHQLEGNYNAEKLAEAKKHIAGKRYKKDGKSKKDKPLKYQYIGDVEELLLDAELVILCKSSLKDIWATINLYKELRNIFAHNDNPIDIVKYPNRKKKVIQIPGVMIISGHVKLDDINIVLDSCNTYEEFTCQLIEEISKILNNK